MSTSDVLVTSLAIASPVLSHLGYVRADALLCITVALIIAWSGYQILRDSIPIPVDARGRGGATRRDRANDSGWGGRAIGALASHLIGHLFAEVTILVDGAMSVSTAHDFTDDMARAIERELETTEAIVHVEPA